ncbi:MAG: hypothetical protein M9958_05950 [Chitinophagales bacterium]|nr:hypothetical protein [Chitinophagales bacterium]
MSEAVEAEDIVPEQLTVILEQLSTKDELRNVYFKKLKETFDKKINKKLKI